MIQTSTFRVLLEVKNPSCMCVIQEYRFYTMSLSQYHGCCQYHESIFIPGVFVYTMSQFLYHESMSVTEARFYTMNPCLYHESLSNPCFHFYTIRHTVFRYTEKKKNKEIQISELQKSNLHIYRNKK